MTRLEEFIKHKLTLRVFLLVSFFVITLPILFSFHYLLFGEKTNGVVTGSFSMEFGKSNYTVSQIKYSVENHNYSFNGPKNLIFDEGEIVEIYYMKNNPQNATLASPIYFYFRSSWINVLCTIFLIFWMAIFFTYGVRNH